MKWKEVGNTVKKVAPMLGTVLGGPVGGAVGGAVSMLMSAFGINSEGDPDPGEVLSRIQMDPEWRVKLRQIESDNQVALQQLVIEQERIYLQDRQSARLADVEKTKATGSRDYNLYILAWVIVVGFFGLVGLLIFRQIPDTNEMAKVALPMLFGAMISGFKDVLGYFFGTSKSSREKTQLLTRKP